MIRSATLRSLAKINLDLRILAKRADGFHELRTVFQTISLADSIDISFEPRRKTEVSLEDALNIPDNLAVRAAHAALEAMKVRGRVTMRLEKHIPMGGGLGGGSSNAAAVLLALPVLAGRRLENVIELAGNLGSDVPFFLTGGTAVAIDRGTELYPLPDVAEAPILLILPGVHVGTGPAYHALGRGLTFMESSSSINTFQAFVSALDGSSVAEAVSSLSSNDFEAVVFAQHPQLKIIAGRLRKQGGSVRMSGSGSTIFAVFQSMAERARAVEALSGDKALKGCRMIDAALVNRKRYRQIWRRQLRKHLDPANPSWPLQSLHAR